MKNNNTVAAIIAINNLILPGLHIKMGYDFEKPITIKPIKAPFTIRAAWKAIETDGHTPSTSTAAVIMRDAGVPATNYRYNPHVAPLTADNLRDDYKDMRYWTTGSYHRTAFDNCAWSKGDFNDLRKCPTCEAYIIAQRNEYISTPATRERDWTQRQPDMKPGEHVIYRGVIWGNRRPTITIDKSGYRVDLIREDLKRRAAQLRRDREKAAADAAAMSTAEDRYRELCEAFAQAKARIMDALQAISAENITTATITPLRDISHALDTWRGLPDAAEDITQFKARAEAARYSSPAEYDAAYTHIMDKLAAILPDTQKGA